MSDTAADLRLGSWAWLEATGGALCPEDRDRLGKIAFRSAAGAAGDLLKWARLARPQHGLGVSDLWPTAPDSALCARAAEAARDLQSPEMLGHGYRTWLYGSALATIDGAALDPELMLVGALFHDVGLEKPVPDRCFTHTSARHARDAVGGLLPEPRLGALSDGIGMHITPGLAVADSALGFYLQAGAMADLAKLRLWEIPREMRARAREAHPLARIDKTLSCCWRNEARTVPLGRAAIIERKSCFSALVRGLS